jgi:hypothetical protein
MTNGYRILSFPLFSILFFLGVEVPESCLAMDKAGRQTMELITS